MMKKYWILLAAAAMFAMPGCNNDDDNGGGDGGGDDINEAGLVFVENGVNYLGYGDQDFPAPVKDYVLDASKTYVIRGWVYIQDGASLKIPAGTVIKGLKSPNVNGSSLIIERGGKIYAEGTADKPVVFTSDQPAGSRKPGDWGGVIICGRAKTNQNDPQIEGGPRSHYGGTDDNDNSGVFSYCRIEFAGFPFGTDQEINGLTMGGVGRGTKIDHVQISYSNDDSFEWFGGSVNCSYLVAYHGWDDDFDTDFGFSGTLQFLLGVRHPKVADQSLSNGFESDNNGSGTTEQPFTTAKFCNATLVGPMGQDPAFVNTSGSGNYIDAGAMYPNNGSRVGQFQSGVQIRRNSHISLANSVIVGYPVGLIIENDKGSQTQAFASENQLIQNVFFGGYTDNNADVTFDNAAAGALSVLGSDINKTWKDVFSNDGKTETSGTKSFSHQYVLAPDRNNIIKATIVELGMNNPVSCQNASFTPNPSANYGPKSGSILVNTAFAVPSGFDAKGNGYAGAFKSDASSDNWMKGWTNFDPQNTVY